MNLQRSRLVLFIAGAAVAIASLASAQTPQPKVLAVEPVIDLGEIPRGQTAVARFKVENQGDGPLVFENTSKSCACMDVTAPDIPAKSEGEVTFTIDTLQLSGPSTASASLNTNDPDAPLLQLTAKLFSKETLVSNPGYYRFLVHQNFSGEGRIRQVVAATDNKDFQITKIELPFPSLRLVGPAEPAAEEERYAHLTGTQWAFEVMLDNKAPIGPLAGTVRVHTDHEVQKVIPIPLSGFVRPVTVFTPQTLEFGRFTPKENGYLDVHFKQFAEETMEITEISTDLEGFTFQPVVIEDGRTWRIRVFPSVERPKGPFRGTVTVKTSSLYQPSTSFEISGTVE